MSARAENVRFAYPRVAEILGTRVWSLDHSDDMLLVAGDAFAMLLDLADGKVLARI